MITAIFGGSFNPPHLGHRRAAELVLQEICPDRLLILPDRVPPHKQLAAGSPGSEERLQLCRLCFDGLARVTVDGRELLREGPSYTADTISELRWEAPEDLFYLVIGSDMLLSFRSWRHFDYLLRECRLAVISREAEDRAVLEAEAERLHREFGASVTVLQAEPLVLSSSEVRKRLKDGRGSELLAPSVYEAILRYGYYGPEAEAENAEECFSEHGCRGKGPFRRNPGKDLRDRNEETR